MNNIQGVNIELRRSDVQELMGKPPSTILKFGILTILLFVISLFISSLFLVCPDVIKADCRLFPYMDADCVSSPVDGRIVYSIDGMKTMVDRGDTLVGIVSQTESHPADTSYIISDKRGMAYKTDVLAKNMKVKRNQRLFHFPRALDSIERNDINGVIYLSSDEMSILKPGQPVEVECGEKEFQFSISDFGNIPNESGKYPVIVTCTDTMCLLNYFEAVECVAKIRTTGETVFEMFFMKRLNVLKKIQ